MAPGVVEGLVSHLLRILAGGTVAFMTLAIAQEWTLFGAAWFGSAETSPTLPERERRAAADAVHLMLTLMEHFYASGGDPRFAERMPASEAVLEEMRADVAYLSGNRRRQEVSLERLQVTHLQPVGTERAEVRTREIWSVGLAWAGEAEGAAPATKRLVLGTYRLSRGDRGWRVESWDPTEPWREPESGPPSSDRP